MVPQIHIRELFAAKNPRVAKLLPRFIYAYLERVLHQAEINKFLKIHGHKEGVDFCKAVISDFEIDIQTTGLENIPPTGNCIFVCNHPLGGMDAMAIVSEVSQVRSDIKFIVNDILMSLKNLQTLFVGVNKHGVSSKEALQKVNTLFASDQAIFLFPAGLVSRKKDGKIRDLEWKKSFIAQARKNDSVVIPVFLDGKLSNWFYSLSNFRKFLGIKANIEMLYLSDELHKQKKRQIPLIFGKPIHASTFDASQSDAKWAEWMKKQVYALQA